jgi:hypothetical protein
MATAASTPDDPLPSATHHRLIDIQSPADLAYLETNVRTLAHQKLDLHFPPAAAQGNGARDSDPLRQKVEAEVDRYVTRTFEGVRTNVSVNGMPLESSGDEAGQGPTQGQGQGQGQGRQAQVVLEPIDTRLQSRLEKLSHERDELLRRVAKLRRETPKAAAEEFQTSFEMEMERDGSNAREAARLLAEKKEDEDMLKLRTVKRQKEMERTFETAIEKLEDVGKGMTDTVGRLERAGGVVEMLEGQ